MKKIGKILVFMVFACVIGVSGYKYSDMLNQEHVEELESMVQDYEEQIDDLKKEKSEISNELKELNDQVYNMKTGEAYSITINHDDETHIWKSENKLFDRETHNIITHHIIQ